MIKKGSDWGVPVHPSTTARRGERMKITPMRYCVQCGLPNDTRKTAWSESGDGIVWNLAKSPADPTVTSGCRFCGSLKWLKAKPIKLPNDRYLPSPDNVKYAAKKQ